jgi:hypothetical protein
MASIPDCLEQDITCDFYLNDLHFASLDEFLVISIISFQCKYHAPTKKTARIYLSQVLTICICNIEVLVSNQQGRQKNLDLEDCRSRDAFEIANH